MSLNIYLTFDGNCREVFDNYKSIFGGDYMAFETYANGPPDVQVADADKDKVMHVSLPVGNSVLMGSDTVEGFGGPVTVGNNFSISVVGQSKEHCDEVFGKLADGGTVTMPLQETFWGSYFGSCRDRFDINWMVNYDMQGKT